MQIKKILDRNKYWGGWGKIKHVVDHFILRERTLKNLRRWIYVTFLIGGVFLLWAAWHIHEMTALIGKF